MAKKASLNLEVDVVNNTASGLKEVEESVAEVADNMGKAAKKPTKNWGGVLELFSGALPRSFQKSIRQFKSVRRSVGRLSKSFKLLKISIAALGLPLLIIAIETLASNWQSVTDFLGFTNKANREAREEFAQLAGEVARVNEMGREYEKILINANSKTDVFNATIEKLNQQFGNAIDAEASLNEQRTQGLILIERAQNVERAQIDVNKTKQKILEQSEKIENLEFERKQKGAKKTQEQIDLEQNLVNNRALLVGYTESLTKAELALEERINKNETAIRARTQAEKDAADEQKKIDQEKEKRDQERKRTAEQNAAFIAQMEIQIANEKRLALISNEDERAQAELQIRQKAERQKLIDAGASAELLADQQMLHISEMTDLVAEQEAIAQEKKDLAIDEQLNAQQRLMDELDIMAMSESDQRLMILADEYTKRKELAEGNADLLMQIEKQYSADLIALNEETEAEKAKAISQAQDMLVKNSRSMFAALERTAEEGSAAQKGFAIADVLLQQAVAMANAVAGATKAAKDTGPAAPFTLAAYIASMIGTVVGSFVSIKGILAEADAPTGGVGGGTVTATRPLVPTNVARTETIDSPPSQAFIVQSELQGATLINDNLYGQTSLNPG
jgi:hypothetical protein